MFLGAQTLALEAGAWPEVTLRPGARATTCAFSGVLRRRECCQSDAPDIPLARHALQGGSVYSSRSACQSLSLGSRASRRPSPRKLMLKTVREMNRPGQRTSQGFSWRKSLPS